MRKYGVWWAIKKMGTPRYHSLRSDKVRLFAGIVVIFVYCLAFGGLVWLLFMFIKAGSGH